jgi:hypothetical protein
MLKRAGLAIGLSAMLVTSAPAAAQERRDRREGARKDDSRDRDRHDRRHRHRDRNDVEIGDTAAGVIAGAIVIGGLAALLGSKKKPPIANEPVLASFADDADPERVASACVSAAEAEGRRTFAIAQVGEVRTIAPAETGYAVDGDLLLRGSWREAGARHPFRCTVDAQAVRSVTIDGVRMLPAVASN